MSDYCIVLKHALVMYFYHVYLDTDREIPFHILEVFLSIVKNLLDQFEYYSKKKFVENEDNVESVEDFSILLHNSYKPFIKWVEEYLVLLIECLDNVFKRNLNLIDDSEPAREYEKMILNLIDFTQIAMEKFPIEEITVRLARLIRGIYSRSPNAASAEKIKEKHRGIIDPKASTNADMHSLEKDAKKRKTVARIQPAGSQSFPAGKKSRALLTLYFNTKEFDNKCDEEFRKLVTEMRLIDSEPRYEKENITHDSFCRCLMKYLSESNDNPEELIYLLVLKVFRRHIEYMKNNEENKIITEWEANEWKEHSSEVIPKQNNLVHIGLVSLICKIIFEVNVSSIIQETFLLAITLLVGGNKLTQEAFAKCFDEDIDSSVLEKVKMHLTDSFEFVRKNMKEWNNLTLKLFYIRFDSLSRQKEAQEAEVSMAFKLLFIRRDIEQVEEHYQICLLIFKFMQLLCEGHNKELQNMLRQQNGGNPIANQKSINFISLTSGLWGTFIKFINPTCVELGSIMLDFVIESTQGPCELNQKEFYHNKVVDYSKDFMNDFSTDREFESKGFRGQSKEQINDLITKTIRMLNALLEANNDKLILDSISQNIDPGYLLKKLTSKFLTIFEELKLEKDHKHYSTDMLQKYLKPTEFEDTFSEAFEIYFFIQNTEDSTGGYTKHIKDLKGLHKLVYDFFKHNTGQIEIIFQGDIQRLYFMIHPICRYLDDNQKRLFLDNVKRETPTEKVTDFLMKAPLMFDRMDYISVLSSKVGFITEGTLTKVRDIAFIIAAIINIYILAAFKKEVVHMDFRIASNSFTPYFMYVFGSIHILASLFMIILWLFLNSKIILMDGWRERFNKYKKFLAAQNLLKSSRLTTDEAVEIQTISTILNKKQIEMKPSDVKEVLKYFGKQSGNPYPLPGLEYYVQNFMFTVKNSSFRFFLFYLALSIAAFGGEWVFLYCIHLLDIVVK